MNNNYLPIVKLPKINYGIKSIPANKLWTFEIMFHDCIYVVLNEVFILHCYAVQFAHCIIIIIIILMQSCDAQNRLAQHSVGHGHIDTPSQAHNSKFKFKKVL